jgi:peroxiredoxin
MAIQVGEKIPSVKLSRMEQGQMKGITTDEIFSGGKVVLFAVPGAFTPTCSEQHLPGFIEQADAIRAKGVDAIVCVSVNDAFVMDAWGRQHGTGDKVMMVADGSAELAKAMGLDFDGSGIGFGIRSQRYALVAEDGVVKKLAVEQPMKFEVSSAERILASL